MSGETSGLAFGGTPNATRGDAAGTRVLPEPFVKTYQAEADNVPRFYAPYNPVRPGSLIIP